MRLVSHPTAFTNHFQNVADRFIQPRRGVLSPNAELLHLLNQFFKTVKSFDVFHRVAHPAFVPILAGARLSGCQ